MIAAKTFLILTLSALPCLTMAASEPDGKAVYQATCAVCHATGVAGAPKLGDAAAWTPRFQVGIDGLYKSVLLGKGAMPARGGNAALSELALQSAVNFMVLQVDAKPASTASKQTPASAPALGKAAAPAPAKTATTAPLAAVAPASAAPAAAPSAPLAGGAPSGQPAGKGLPVYQASCNVCHGTGVAGSPKLGDAAAWAPRIKSGVAGLYNSALQGKAGMPARGGNPALTEADVKAAVDYMLAQVSGHKTALAIASTVPSVAVATPVATSESGSQAGPSSAATPAPLPPPATPAVQTVAVAAAPARGVAAAPVPVALPTPAVVANANAFNRLLRPPGKRNLPPSEDGIHDPTNDGTLALQAPLAAFAALPKSNSGNRIDWVKALTENKIQPRYDRLDPNAVPAVMDLNIVREVKGSMPDVVYPHKQHTEWLDCSNCHPAIFIPQKGANQISMAAILLGQKCGVCHGKVAFPVSECRLCHSKNKPAAAASASAK